VQLIRSVALDPTRHGTDAFDCGNDELNRWLVRFAAHAREMGTANTYVWLSHGAVVGYYALAGHHLVADELPAKIAKGGPRLVPAALIAKFALDRRLQGRGLGGALLADALTRILTATAAGPAVRLVVVDAIDDDAATFYVHHGFVAIPGHPRRLVLKLSHAARSIRAGGKEQ
jgi:GNAT superfamily N-acetyltransferase